jgi:hypothetical protein
MKDREFTTVEYTVACDETPEMRIERLEWTVRQLNDRITMLLSGFVTF